MNSKEQNAVDQLRRIADFNSEGIRIREHTDVLVSAIHVYESEGVRHKSLAFLTGAVWSQVRLADCQRVLRPVLRTLDDDKLIEAFYDCFINDFKLKRVGSNHFRLTWEEYNDDLVQRSYRGVPEGDYNGDQLLDFMMDWFETPGHFCHLYNIHMQKCQGVAIFPHDHQNRNVYIRCSYRGVG